MTSHVTKRVAAIIVFLLIVLPSTPVAAPFTPIPEPVMTGPAVAAAVLLLPRRRRARCG
jgi:hypothetical protein